MKIAEEMRSHLVVALQLTNINLKQACFVPLTNYLPALQTWVN